MTAYNGGEGEKSREPREEAVSVSPGSLALAFQLRTPGSCTWGTDVSRERGETHGHAQDGEGVQLRRTNQEDAPCSTRSTDSNSVGMETKGCWDVSEKQMRGLQVRLNAQSKCLL